MDKKLKAILLLDNYSRSIIKTNVSELGLHGISFINSLSELTDELISVTNNVIVLEGYMLENNSISDLKLYKELFSLNIYYIGLDELYLTEMNDIASVFRSDITVLDIDIIQAAIYHDSSLEMKETLGEENTILNHNIDFAKILLQSSSERDVKLISLVKEYMSQRYIIEEQRNLIDKIKGQISFQGNLIQKLKNENSIFLRNYSTMVEDSIELNRTLQQYETILTKDVYEKISISNYSNRPLIIYLKEYEELLHLNSFIETLYYMFINQCHKSVKIVQLFDSNGSRKVDTLPEYYKIIYNRFLIQDLVVNNFIAKTGDYKKLFEVLLTNTSNLDVLIVIDRKEHNDTVFTGTFLELALCRNYKHLDNFRLIKDTAIVNNAPDEYNSWDTYEIFNDSGISKEQRFIYLSSRPVIQKVYNLAKFYDENI